MAIKMKIKPLSADEILNRFVEISNDKKRYAPRAKWKSIDVIMGHTGDDSFSIEVLDEEVALGLTYSEEYKKVDVKPVDNPNAKFIEVTEVGMFKANDLLATGEWKLITANVANYSENNCGVEQYHSEVIYVLGKLPCEVTKQEVPTDAQDNE